jgi:hypothetical protein
LNWFLVERFVTVKAPMTVISTGAEGQVTALEKEE